jgi:hypothetical protein
MKKFYSLITIIIIIACQSNSLYRKLSNELDVSNTNFVIIATDYDCSSCILSIKNLNKGQKNTKGLYYSKHPKDILVKLNKLFPDIKWKAGKNKNLLKYLRKQKDEGPYYIKIKNHSAFMYK